MEIFLVQINQQGPQLNNFASYFNLGADLRQQGDKQGAIKAWTQALRIDPSNAYAYYYRGVTWAEIGDYTRAIEDLTKALQIDPKYFNVYRQLEKIAQQLLVNNNILQFISQEAIPYYLLGEAYFKCKDYEKAIKNFEQVLQFNPKLAQGYYNRGKSRHQLKDKEGAIEDFQKAAQLFCNNNQVEELAKWTPFELGESNREEAINYLIQYLSTTSSCNEKRIAASAIQKLAKKFRESCQVAIPYLLENLSNPAPQVRQYTLKALNLLTLPDSAIPIIKAIADKDAKDYNKDLAQVILKKLIFCNPKK